MRSISWVNAIVFTLIFYVSLPVVQAPDAGIPKNLVQDAESVTVIPAVKKVAFGFGGPLRRKGNVGTAVDDRLRGASFGFQLGGQSIDVVIFGSVPVNEVLGPMMTKFAILKADEVREEPPGAFQAI